MTATHIDRNQTVYIAGHRGLAGSALWRKLEAEGFSNLVGATSKELDLRDRTATAAFIENVRPDVIFLAAARVGGIVANATAPAEFISDNLQIQLNVMDAAARLSVPKLVFLGSSCIYPRLAPQPLREDYLMTGALEPTNDAYAVAKIAGIKQVEAVRRQYGLHWISLMPTNLYGPGDNFHPQHSHVVPGMMRRFHEARAASASEVVVWGTGTPRRELLFADDFADAALFALENYDSPTLINVGRGEDLEIREIARKIAATVGFEGEIVQDPSKPDGTPQKLLDVSRMRDLGWSASTDLDDGLAATYQWFLDHQGAFSER
jgi:GDP-L-fucose synthase